MSKTYYKNIFFGYSKILFFTFIGFFLIILIFDILEISRITTKYSLKFTLVIRLALMKNYSSLSQTIPMIILISSLLHYNSKNKNNELIAAKSIGISNFNIILPVISAVLIFGIINITIINPIGTMLLKKYQNYEANKFKKEKSLISISKSGIWLKNKFNNQNLIINALRVSQISNTMNDVKIFFINEDGELEKQIFSKLIAFKSQSIIIQNATIIDKNFKILKEKELILPIKISISQILENFTTIDTISFFELLNFIKITKESGLSINKYLLFFLKELMSPIYIVSMSLISFFFSNRVNNRKKYNLTFLYGLTVGFIIYFLTNFIYALGSSGSVSVFLAAFFPTITSNIIALYLILYKNNQI
ncbi:LptF/LptG family permease [Rickettsiales endosymbiont of Trichoplax sp. H2]|uniref:LptF/LptG family permease n=1 Tax=Rickettsiales endosymbiont of Trichoplax sp. H2 TaxID=2021221 RepID=UPI0012B2B1E3|nr:LptF/LptG family permease [Rickettsiales endosymbiont of Trichoplax sp. H2]